MQQKKLAFIGAGNMGRHHCGLIKSGYAKENILAANASQKLDGLKAGWYHHTSNDEACQFADAIVLAVKPQIMGEMCGELQENNDLSTRL